VMLLKAKQMGVFGTRSGMGAKRNNPTPGAASSDGSHAYSSELRHPGLIAARDGDVAALKALLSDGM